MGETAMASCDLADLQVAIEEGKAAGLPAEEVHGAEIVFSNEQRKVAARINLERASRTRNIDELEAAIAQGSAARLKTHELNMFKSVLNEELEKVAAHMILAKATR